MSEEPTEQILEILARVTETDEVFTQPDLALFDLQVLDSMRTVELIVALGTDLDIQISPAEFAREHWATPRLFLADVLQRLAVRA